MNVENTPPHDPTGDAGASGNRWEPAADETAPLAGQPAAGPAPTADPTPAPAPYAAGPARRSWRDRLRPDRLGPRARTGLAAGAAALIVGGLGGFAVGHATGDGGEGHGFDGQRFGGQRFGGQRPDGQPFDGHGDHDGFPPQGQLSGQPGGSTGELPGQGTSS